MWPTSYVSQIQKGVMSVGHVHCQHDTAQSRCSGLDPAQCCSVYDRALVMTLQLTPILL